MIQSPNFSDLEWLVHGFGLRDSVLPSDIKAVRQIHSGIVLNAADLHTDESADDVTRPTEGDALISDRAGVTVGVKTADCVPVLLVDPAMPAVAAIHAGWRGSAANIVGAAVHKLMSRWGTRPENIRAAIGPSVGLCCYEVGPDVARHFGAWIPGLDLAAGPVHLDLKAVNEAQLRQAGVIDIWISPECTFCTADRFYSYRRERDRAGRMMSFIGLQKHIGRTSEGPPGNASDV